MMDSPACCGVLVGRGSLPNCLVSLAVVSSTFWLYIAALHICHAPCSWIASLFAAALCGLRFSSSA